MWGVWRKDRLYLSIGTPETSQALACDSVLTVHLDSGTDVVIVEGRVGAASTDSTVVSEHDAKYDWHYDLDEYGPLHCLKPDAVLAWWSADRAGETASNERVAGGMSRNLRTLLVPGSVGTSTPPIVSMSFALLP